MLQLNENYSNSNSVAVLGTASPSDMGQIFSYNGNSVRMRKMNGYIFVCLTDFAKPFPDKNLSHIVNSKELTDYVARMSEIQNCSSADLLQVTKGGDVSQQGTWAHHRVAIRVAQKLSTDFAIWVDNKIEELLITGSASLQPKLPNFNNPAEAARAWADQYEKNQTLALEVEKKEQEKQSIIEETVDKAFKKILFSFGSLRNCCTFAVLQVDRIIYLAEQAVKLLIFYMGIFYAHTLGYWRLPIRKLLCALRGRLSTCSSVYGNRFLFAYCLHK